MPASEAARNTAIDAVTVAFVEIRAVSGGPAVSDRVAIAIGAASGGDRLSTADAEPLVNADVTARFGVLFDLASGGTEQFETPLGSDGYKVGNVVADTFRIVGHGLANDDKIMLYGVNGQAVPAGITQASVYYVIGVSGDTFQISLTQGGAAVTGITDGPVKRSKCTEYTGPAGQQFNVKILTGTRVGINS